MRRVLVAGVAMLALAGMDAGAQAAVRVDNVHGSARAVSRPAPAARNSAKPVKKKPVKKITAVVDLTSTPAGAVLTTKSGRVLFVFTKDKRNKDVCKQSKKCEIDWPPVTTTVKPVAGPGVKKSLLGTIGYAGKVKEVTYDGRPLHTYKFDDGPSVSFTFIGIKQFGGDWYALTAAGKVVKNPGG